ncbi:hypothetical protein X797_007041 [Metarhizium robertsii]|uniref:Uncharacterized protein n=2 Tax=Metarhizium robertsii TaxID=568076 RepID=E9F609_METRA|nr:uncharacterized protein MAA_07708 [Metarhizium robertsii ARSEF 23]EFY96895.1 hypothetical protein MAA_07708 [Metarhizium robertsii ARSEF 23]EXU99912.1 hypothetical protein X797_007041 [Metarhizium robertsii]
MRNLVETGEDPPFQESGSELDEEEDENDNTQELEFEAPEDLCQLEEIKEVKRLVARFGPPGRYFGKKTSTEKADDTAEALEPFGNYRRGSKRAAAWTAQDALYTGLREFARAGGRLNDEGISLIREDPYYPLWREVALVIINEYRSRVKHSHKQGKPRSQAEIGLIRRIKNKAKNAVVGWHNNGRVEIRGQSYPANSDTVLPSRAQVLATRYLDKLGSVNGTLFGDLYSLGRHDLGFVTLSNDQKVGGIAVVAESPAANAEIKNIKDEIASMKIRVAQEFCKQTNLINGKAKESKEAAENAREYTETEIGKLNANIKTKTDNLGKRIKESFALRDKEIDQLKEENKKLGEENLKLSKEFAKLLKIVNKIKGGIEKKRPQDEDKVSPPPKKPKPSKPSPGKGKTAGEAAGKATGKTTKGESKSASQPPEEEEEEEEDFIW